MKYLLLSFLLLTGCLSTSTAYVCTLTDGCKKLISFKNKNDCRDFIKFMSENGERGYATLTCLENF